MYMLLKSFTYTYIRFGISENLEFVNWIIHPSFENQFPFINWPKCLYPILYLNQSRYHSQNKHHMLY